MSTRLLTRLVGPRGRIAKRTPHGKTIESLTQTNLPNDRYRYYHATKGWRDRRAWGVNDRGLVLMRGAA